MSHVGHKRSGRPPGRVAGSLRWEGERDGVPKTTVWRERLREEVIAEHPWLRQQVPWSYRHFERYRCALRTWAREPARRREWVEYANANAARWLRERDPTCIPWTVSRFLIDQLEVFARNRRWPPKIRRGGAGSGPRSR